MTDRFRKLPRPPHRRLLLELRWRWGAILTASDRWRPQANQLRQGLRGQASVRTGFGPRSERPDRLGGSDLREWAGRRVGESWPLH